MTTTDTATTTPAATDPLVARAAAVGASIGEHAERHDRDGTFVVEAYEELRAAGLLAAGVPEELGGAGATIEDLAAIQRELAHHCGSTALASAMHQHVVAFTAWRYRRGMPGAEATLRRVVDDGIVLVSTGGADLTHPRGRAERVDGGYLVSGTKIFASQAPVGAVMSTMFPYDDPEAGRRVLNMAVPLADEGVRVLDTWDSLGMRGTGSHDVQIDQVFVPDERVLADRPHGVLDPPLQVILCHALPIISAVYLGIAEAAFEAALRTAERSTHDPIVQRQVGEMAHRLRVAGWSLDAALRAVGDDPQPSVARLTDVLGAKHEVTTAAVAVCDLAMDVAGGAAFYRGSVIERAYRDVRAGRFHPLSPERALAYTGRVTLGADGELVP